MVRCVTVTPICRSFISLHKAVRSIRSVRDGPAIVQGGKTVYEGTGSPLPVAGEKPNPDPGAGGQLLPKTVPP